MKKNYVEDLLTAKELKEYQEKDWPENLPILHKALLKKLETEPDYEVWVPVYYTKFVLLTKDNKVIDYHFKYAFVSNKGRISFLNKLQNIYRISGDGNDYGIASLKLDADWISITVHRAVACNFVPIPDELKDIGMHYLQVNHIDGKKNNSDFTNLEWCTQQQNMDHAWKNKLIIKQIGLDHHRTMPVLGEVLIEGPYKGFKFIRSGAADIIELLGVKSAANVNECCRGKRNNAKGCKWTFATGEDVEKYSHIIIPDELRKLIRNAHGKKKAPIQATRIIDGFQFILRSRADAVLHGLDWSKVCSCANGKRAKHNGHTFKRIED